MSTIRCKFEFECPQRWSALTPTSSWGIRFCSSCNSNVYLATSVAAVEQFASEDKCVALVEDAMFRLGRPEKKDDIEPYVLIVAQAYSAKQLYLLKRVLTLGGSMADTKDIFHMKAVKIEGMGGKDALTLSVRLKAIDIDCQLIS